MQNVFLWWAIARNTTDCAAEPEIVSRLLSKRLTAVSTLLVRVTWLWSNHNGRIMFQKPGSLHCTEIGCKSDTTLRSYLVRPKAGHAPFKVPITPKYFLRLNNSLHLFETHCTFLHLFSPNLDFLQAVKVTKSDHHLFHDRASKGYGSIPGLMSQTYLHACLQRLNTMQISL